MTADAFEVVGSLESVLGYTTIEVVGKPFGVRQLANAIRAALDAGSGVKTAGDSRDHL